LLADDDGDEGAERVGGAQTLKVQVRIIAATNKNLEDEVDAARFREDLYYRLNVMPINMPPLRDRLEDLPELAQFLLARISRAQGGRPAPGTFIRSANFSLHESLSSGVQTSVCTNLFHPECKLQFARIPHVRSHESGRKDVQIVGKLQFARTPPVRRAVRRNRNPDAKPVQRTAADFFGVIELCVR
jgi:hypothetical protein